MVLKSDNVAKSFAEAAGALAVSAMVLFVDDADDDVSVENDDSVAVLLLVSLSAGIDVSIGWSEGTLLPAYGVVACVNTATAPLNSSIALLNDTTTFFFFKKNENISKQKRNEKLFNKIL